MATSSTPNSNPPSSSGTSVMNPLSIILVKNGSKGDRLLFRYPYKIPLSQRGADSSLTPDGNNLAPRRRRKVSCDVIVPRRPAPTSLHALDSLAVETSFESSFLSPLRDGRSASINARPIMRKTSRTSPAGLLFSNLRRSPGVSMDKSVVSNTTNDIFIDDEEHNRSDMDKFTPAEGAKMLNELSDKDLSNLLAVGSDLSERKFELKLNYIRFVGHPTLMQHPKLYRNMAQQGLQTSVKLFHIVFCLNAVASHSIVKCFHDLSKRLGIALRHEEYRCLYLTQEFKKIVAIHDELCTLEPDDQNDPEGRIKLKNRMFDEIVSKSKLARMIKYIYNDVVEKGRTFMRVNGWIQISFCLPQKIHILKYREDQSTPLVEPEAIHKCLEAIRPYHAILLLVEPDDLTDTLLLDASSTISRLLQVYSPLKSLQTLAADADLTLSQTVEIASHLVYWAQATVIYPLCESNIYVVSPDIPITSEGLVKEFTERFPGLSLAQTLADFSLPMPLGERINPVLGGSFFQAQQVSLVIWMLKYHLLIHLYTYVYLTTYFDGTLMDSGDSGVDYLSAYTGNVDGTTSLNIRPFEVDEDEVTASDSFSETALDDVNIINNDPSGIDKDDKRPDSMPATPNTTTSEHVVNTNIPVGDTFPELNEAVRRAVSLVKAPLTVQDVRLFSRLSKYFTGDFHLEEIMYRENVRRSQLMLLLDKFRDVLITIEKEDSEINFFQLS